MEVGERGWKNLNLPTDRNSASSDLNVPFSLISSL
jgi:hypothetical protein